ncbi:hypothetical protein MTP99_018928 [Tenebrio molitor]|jgi:hypothetical protein|nr:hypothetical protein MTP99_018928 [Tenebrio molitor]
MVGRVGGGGAGTMGLVCVWSVGQVGTVRRRSPKRGRRAGEARGRITDDEEKSKGVRDEEVVVSFHGMCILPRKMMTFGLAKCTTGVDGHGPRDGGTPILLSGGGGHRPSSGQSPDRSCTPWWGKRGELSLVAHQLRQVLAVI